MSKSRQRILVILFPVLGDVLLGTPLLRALRQRYPEARIDVLVNVGCGVMLEGNADVDAVIEVERRPGWSGYLRLARRILRRYELALTMALSDRATIYAWAAAGRRVTWIDPGKRYYGLVRRAYSDWPRQARGPTHPLHANAYAAKLLDLDYDGRLVPPTAPGARSRVNELLAGVNRPLAILHPASRMPHKHWHDSGWRAISGDLQQRGFQLVVTGGSGAGERAYVERLFGGLDGVLFAAGRLHLGDMAELLARGRLFVGVDTMISHLAASAGLPTVVLFGPEDPTIWAPWPAPGDSFAAPLYASKGDCYQSNVAVVHSSMPCVPCRRLGCDNRADSTSACLDEIQPQRVLSALAQVMTPAVSDT